MEVNKHINFLKRRGLLIKESSDIDIPLDDVYSLDTRAVDDRNVINIHGLCNRVKLSDEKNNTNLSPENIYCRLVNTIPKNEYNKVSKNLDVIYHFLRPGNDNRVKFHKLIGLILDSDYMSINTINLLSEYLEEINTKRDPQTLQMLNQLKDVNVPLNSEEELIRLLNKIKTTEYSEYENSFVGEYFKPLRTGLRLQYRELDSELDDTMVNLLKNQLQHKNTSNTDLVYKLFNSIVKNTNLNSLIKADLECIKELKDNNGVTIIRTGEFVEVKKLDYGGDSYLSEFFSIYKDSNIPDFTNKKDFYDLYNEVIDMLFIVIRQSSWGKSVLDSISNNFAGIIYQDGDLDRFIPSNEIELYWSNAGQPRCETQRRLSIRYRVKEGKRSSYIFNHNTDIMDHENVTINPHGRILCDPHGGTPMKYPKRIT